MLMQAVWNIPSGICHKKSCQPICKVTQVHTVHFLWIIVVQVSFIPHAQWIFYIQIKLLDLQANEQSFKTMISYINRFAIIQKLIILNEFISWPTYFLQNSNLLGTQNSKNWVLLVLRPYGIIFPLKHIWKNSCYGFSFDNFHLKNYFWMLIWLSIKISSIKECLNKMN